MLQVILGVIRCISDFQKPCASKTAGLRVKDTSRSLCYPALCGHCFPSCQGERQAPGLLVITCTELMLPTELQTSPQKYMTLHSAPSDSNLSSISYPRAIHKRGCGVLGRANLQFFIAKYM